MVIKMSEAKKEITIYYCGHEECASGHFFGPAIRPHYLMHFILKGKGHYRVNGKKLFVQTGEAFLIQPEEITYYKADEEEPWEYVWMAFDGARAEQILQKCHIQGDKLVCTWRGSGKTEEYIRTMGERFESGEYSQNELLGFFYLIMAAVEKNVAKGFFSVAFGLILSVVGMDVTSVNYRLSFGNMHLQSGLDLIPISVGIFAIAEMLALLTNQTTGNLITEPQGEYKTVTVPKEMARRWKILLKSSIIGTIIGILPGTGGAIAAFISYGEAKRSSKEPKQFPFGAIEGIIAPDRANNAAVGGSFVPLLSLGIPEIGRAHV